MRVQIVQAVSSVRVGDGAVVGAVDLPLARERHTRWPLLPGSSMKGALRGFAIAARCDEADEIAVFGSRPPLPGARRNEEPLRCGSLRVQQGTLLALPVRSLQGTFALLTCPTALARFGRAAGVSIELPQPAIEDAWVDPSAADRLGTRARGVAVGGSFAGVVWLEDLDLVGVLREEIGVWASEIARFTADDAPLEHLVVVHDDVFAHAATAWTEHRTRNAVGDDGIVKDKLLFSVELLPAETLFWTVVDGDDRGLLPGDGELFGIGGHRSVGMGQVTWYGRRA